MKDIDKKKIPNISQTKRTGRSERRDSKLHQEDASRTLTAKATESNKLVSDSTAGTESSDVYENMVIHYADDVHRSDQASRNSQMVAKENKEEIDDHFSDYDNGSKQGKEEESDCETVKSSVSSQGNSHAGEDEKLEGASRVPKKLVKRDSSQTSPSYRRQTNSSQVKASRNTTKKSTRSNGGPSKSNIKSISNGNSRTVKVPPEPSSESSEGVEEKPNNEVKAIDTLDEASNGTTQSVGSDSETVDVENNGDLEEDKAALNQKLEAMESKIEKLEAELREVAALEISLYSVVPEHGSSAHKVHTPARRLSRLYIHACKYWTQDKRATIARNTVSGLVLIAKSCGNDVPRLTFWLSNTIVLREIIARAFGNSCHSSPVGRLVESNGAGRGKPSSLKWKGISGSKQGNKADFMQFVDDWQETRTFTSALEKVESWIFSRIAESVWWQTLTPNMQPPVEDLYSEKNTGKLLGPALGDQQQGNFSINLWKTAFQDAFQRLCPVRAGGHECGCLPVLARKVMELCVNRLDVAMFNAILRESAHEIPTDPVSDPIVCPKVLPIPAGDLSFGSGAQLKNSVGNWSRWLTDLFGMDADDSLKDQTNNEDDDRKTEAESKSFYLLNALSDILMLPKDMLMDRSIRKEVCSSISLPLMKRILCNFTPDEFCPDPVPGAVLEALNAESILERKLSGESSGFPFTAAPIVYVPPATADVAEKVAEVAGKSELARNASIVQRKGYTSDEELEELDSPLASIIDKMIPSPTVVANGNGNGKHSGQTGCNGVNIRYDLLREVWSV